MTLLGWECPVCKKFISRTEAVRVQDVYAFMELLCECGKAMMKDYRTKTE